MLSSIEKEDTHRRDRHDIVIEILKTAVKGNLKTRIMYKARLSYAQVNFYLPQLVESGFIENQTIKRGKRLAEVYSTTASGLKIIQNFESMGTVFNPRNGFSKEH